MIQSFTAINAHGRSQVSSLSLIETNKMMTISFDSYVKIWDLRNFEQLTSKKFKESYLTALLPTDKQFIIGNGSGELMFLDRNSLSVNSVVKIHNDCINDVKIIDDNIVTVSSDGTMVILDKNMKKQKHVVKVGAPIKQVESYKKSYHLGGCRSFQVSSEFKIKKQANVNKFLCFSGELYGLNDEKGLFCISKKFNTYVPCENMIEFNGGIVGISWSTLTYFKTYPDDERITYSSAKMKQYIEGDSILSLASVGKRIFAGSEAGKIYTFNVNSNFHWYDSP